MIIVKYYQNKITRECVKITKPSNPNIKIKKEDFKNTVMRPLKLREVAFNSSGSGLFSLPIDHYSG